MISSCAHVRMSCENTSLLFEARKAFLFQIFVPNTQDPSEIDRFGEPRTRAVDQQWEKPSASPLTFDALLQLAASETRLTHTEWKLKSRCDFAPTRPPPSFVINLSSNAEHQRDASHGRYRGNWQKGQRLGSNVALLLWLFAAGGSQVITLSLTTHLCLHSSQDI